MKKPVHKILFVILLIKVTGCATNPIVRWPPASILETSITERRSIQLFVYGKTRSRGRVVVPVGGMDKAGYPSGDWRFATDIPTGLDKFSFIFMNVFTLGLSSLMPALVYGVINGTDQTTPYNLRYDRLAKQALGEFFDINDQSCCYKTEEAFLKDFKSSTETAAVVIEANTVVSPVFMTYRPVLSRQQGDVSIFRRRPLYVPLLGTRMTLYKKTGKGDVIVDGSIRTVQTIENCVMTSPYGPYHTLTSSVTVPGRIPKTFKAPGVGIGPGNAEATFMLALQSFIRLVRRNHMYDIFRLGEKIDATKKEMGSVQVDCRFQRDEKGVPLFYRLPDVYIGNNFNWTTAYMTRSGPGDAKNEFAIAVGTFSMIVSLYDVVLQFPVSISTQEPAKISIDITSKNGKKVKKSEDMQWVLNINGAQYEYDPAEQVAQNLPLAPSFIFAPPTSD